jgi:hypothetical protein
MPILEHPMNPSAILTPENPKYRLAILFGIVFVLMAPYLGFVMFYSQRFPSNQWPAWFINTIAVWFIANFLIIMLVVKRIFRGRAVQPQKDRRASAIVQFVGLYLLIVWSGFFLTGRKKPYRESFHSTARSQRVRFCCSS